MDTCRICRVLKLLTSHDQSALRAVLPAVQYADQFYSNCIARCLSIESDAQFSGALIPYHVDDDTREITLLMSVPGSVNKRSDYILNNKRIWVAVKGGYDRHLDNNSILNAALREWHEETHIDLQNDLRGKLDLALGMSTQYSGKNVVAFAARCDQIVDPQTIAWYSNTTTFNGIEIPETEHLRWITVRQAQKLVYKPHLAFINRLQRYYDNNQ